MFSQILYNLTQNQNIQSINYPANLDLQQPDVIKLGNIITLHGNLVHLRIRSAGINNSNITYISNALKQQPQIQTLDLKLSDISVVNFIDLLEAIQHLTFLENIVLTYPLNNQTLAVLTAALCNKYCLRSIKITFAAVDDKNIIKEFVQNLQKDVLDEISIGNADDATVKAITKFLPNLQSISLNNYNQANHITNTGAVYLANYMKNNDRLLKLELCNNAITEVGASVIMQSFIESALVQINIDYNNFALSNRHDRKITMQDLLKLAIYNRSNNKADDSVKYDYNGDESVINKVHIRVSESLANCAYSDHNLPKWQMLLNRFFLFSENTQAGLDNGAIYSHDNFNVGIENEVNRVNLMIEEANQVTGHVLNMGDEYY